MNNIININNIVSIISVISVIIITIKTNFFNKDKVLKGNYLYFKTIRKEYLEDKINGYFAFQQYFNAKIPTEEMDFVIESSDAYKIFYLLKAAIGKYDFINKEFIPKITKCKYVLPVFGLIIFFPLLIGQLLFAEKIISCITLYNFLILLILNLCISLPTIINCLFSIIEINCTFKLFKLTAKKEETQNVPDTKIR